MSSTQICMYALTSRRFRQYLAVHTARLNTARSPCRPSYGHRQRPELASEAVRRHNLHEHQVSVCSASTSADKNPAD